MAYVTKSNENLVLAGLLAFVMSLSLASSGLANPSDSCSCTDGEKLAYLRDAEALIIGRIMAAKIVEGTEPTMSISLDVMHSLRGSHPDFVSINTPMTEKCGIPAWLGAPIVVAQSSVDEDITLCSGSGNWQYKNSYWLEYALITVAFVDMDPVTVDEYFQRGIHRGTEREYLDIYFELLSILDPTTSPNITENTVKYRDLVFSFTDGKLSEYYWD